MKEKEITVLVVEPRKEPKICSIQNTLKVLQGQVDGLIEVACRFDDDVCVIVNEEGKLEGLAPNRGLYDAEGTLYDILCGTMLVIGVSGAEFCSLSPEQIKKYSEIYRCPEF